MSQGKHLQQRQGSTLTSPSPAKPYLMATLAFLKELGAEQIKQIPLVGPALAALEKLADAEDDQALDARIDVLLTVGAQTQDQLDGLVALSSYILALQTQHGAQLIELQERLAAIGLSPSSEQLSDFALDTALVAYRGRVARDCQYADYRGVEGVTRAEHVAAFPLDEVYIPPHLLAPQAGVAEGREHELLHQLLTPAEELVDEQRMHLEREYAELTGRRWRAGGKGVENPLPVGEALREPRHTVILGGPGVGKSTLTRYLARTLALGPEAAQACLAWEDVPTPVILPLAAYADARRRSGGLSLQAFLETHMAERGGEPLRAAINRELAAGRLFLLLDGVDEVPEARERAAIVQAIERFLADYGANRVLVTSRPYGYTRLAGAITHLELPNFTSEQVQAFIQHWQRAFERWRHPQAPDLAQADREAASLLEELGRNPKVAELATNPLMLVIIALIRQERTRLPEQRVQLYDRAVNTLMDTWNYWRSQAGADVGGERLPLDRLVPVWAAVAEWLRRTRPTGVAHRQELKRKLVEVLEAKEYDETDPAATAESYLNAAAARAGLLEERGKDIFAFWHPTFEEFLTAVDLATPTARAAERLLPLRDDPRWREVILLAVGYVGVVRRDPETATALVEAIAFESPGPLEAVFHTHLRLAAACLADDVGVRRSLAQRILVALAEVIRAQPYTPFEEAFVATVQALPRLRPDAATVAALAHLAEHTDSNVPMKATRLFVLAEYIGSEVRMEATRLLSVESTEHTGSEVRMEATRLFANAAVTHPEAQELCQRLLKDSDADVRCHAALGLARAGDYRPPVWQALSHFKSTAIPAQKISH